MSFRQPRTKLLLSRIKLLHYFRQLPTGADVVAYCVVDIRGILVEVSTQLNNTSTTNLYPTMLAPRTQQAMRVHKRTSSTWGFVCETDRAPTGKALKSLALSSGDPLLFNAWQVHQQKESQRGVTKDISLVGAEETVVIVFSWDVKRVKGDGDWRSQACGNSLLTSVLANVSKQQSSQVINYQAWPDD